MFEFLKLFQEHSDSLSKLPQMLKNWDDFLGFLRKKLDRIDERIDGIDSKLQYLIDGPPAITPSIHSAILAEAMNDPRNRIAASDLRSSSQ
jgi:hypothetical protein